MIDPQDFRILVEETYETLDHRLEADPSSTASVAFDERALSIAFEDGSHITLVRDEDRQVVDVTDAAAHTRSYAYDSVEELWFDTGSGGELFAFLERAVSDKVRHRVVLSEE